MFIYLSVITEDVIDLGCLSLWGYIYIYLLAVIRVVMVIGDVSALGGFIINGKSISILDGGYRGVFRFDSCRCGKRIGTYSRINCMCLDDGY